MTEIIRPLVICICLFGCIGLFLGTLFPFLISYAVFFAALFAVFSLLFRPTILIIILSVLISFLSCFLYAAYVSQIKHDSYDITIESGKLIRDVDVRTDRTLFVVSPDDVVARISTPFVFQCTVGDMVTFSKPIRLTPPQPFLTDNEKLFLYDGYLRARGISFVGYTSDTVTCNPSEKKTLSKMLFTIKHTFLNSLRSYMHEPYTSLGAGILLGEKGSIDKEILDNFNKTSLTHILVLSGYNIMIIVAALSLLLLSSHRYVRVALISLTILGFVIITGGEPATVRAAIMGVLALIALSAHKKQAVGVVVAVVALGMGMYSPALLTYDPGFHLSFIATIGLVTLVPYIEKVLFFITEKMSFRSITSASLAAQIAVLPYFVYLTGTISLIGVAANILILPVIPLMMLLVFLTGLSGLIPILPIGNVFAYLTSVGFKWIIALVDFLAHLPWATISSLSISGTTVFLLYTISAAILCLFLFIRGNNITSLQKAFNSLF